MTDLSFRPKASVNDATLAQLLSQEDWVASAEHIHYYDESDGLFDPNVSYVLVTFKSGGTCKISADPNGCKVTGIAKKYKKLVVDFFDKQGFRVH